MRILTWFRKFFKKKEIKNYSINVNGKNVFVEIEQ